MPSDTVKALLCETKDLKFTSFTMRIELPSGVFYNRLSKRNEVGCWARSQAQIKVKTVPPCEHQTSRGLNPGIAFYFVLIYQYAVYDPVCDSPFMMHFREVLFHDKRVGMMSLKWRSKNIMRVYSSDRRCTLCEIFFHHGEHIAWTKRWHETLTLKDF